MARIADKIQNEVQQRKRHFVDNALVPDTGPELPKYESMRIKQVRMTDEMIEALYARARQLMDQRPEKNEKITASTVARLCIAYTLQKIDREGVSSALRGSTEEELLEQLHRHLS